MNEPATPGMPARVSAAVARWLSDQHITETPVLAALPSGSGHCVWRVRVTDGDWVFRLRQASPLGYVADHQREQHIWLLAARAGLAPRLHHVDGDGELWISDYVARGNRGASASELGQLMHRIHQLPSVPWQLDLSSQLERYRQAAAKRGVDSARLPDADEPTLARAIKTLAALPVSLCHNDLLADNVLGGSTRFKAIDWEYAAMGSPYFDAAAALANLAHSEHDAFLCAAFPHGWMPDLLLSAKTIYRAIDSAWQAAYGPADRVPQA